MIMILFQTSFEIKFYLSKFHYLLGELLIRGFRQKTTWMRKKETVNHLFMECALFVNIIGLLLFIDWGLQVSNPHMCLLAFITTWWFTFIFERYSSLFSGDLVGYFVDHLEGT